MFVTLYPDNVHSVRSSNYYSIIASVSSAKCSNFIAVAAYAI